VKLSEVSNPESLRRRLYKRVIPDGFCLIWQGYRTPKGYGQLGIGSRQEGTIQAHRAAYLLEHGELPDNKVICHTCDNPPCVNVAHLYAGTPKENTQDMVRKGRARGGVKYGEEHPNSKLSNAHSARIIELVQSGNSHREVGKMFGVAHSTVGRIARGECRSKTSSQVVVKEAAA
jgi:hypothetical protein